MRRMILGCMALLALLGCSTDDGGDASVDPVSPEGDAVIVAANDVSGLLAGDTIAATLNGIACDLSYSADMTAAPAAFAMVRNDSSFLFNKQAAALPKSRSVVDSAVLGAWKLYYVESNGESSYVLSGPDTGMVLTLTASADGGVELWLADHQVYVPIALSPRLSGSWTCSNVTIDGILERGTEEFLRLSFLTGSRFSMFSSFDDITCEGRVTLVGNNGYLTPFMFGAGCSCAICDTAVSSAVTAEILADGDSLSVISVLEGAQYIWHLSKRQ